MGHITFSEFKNVEIITSTRQGGVSKGSYDSLNLCYLVKDKQENVDKNREIYFKEIEIDASHLAIISTTTCKEFPIIYTSEKDTSIGILHSDTIPLFFYSKNKKFIGAIQIGDFEISNKLTTYMMRSFMKNQNVKSDDVYVYIAPSITFPYCKIPFFDRKKVMQSNLKDGVKCANGKYCLDKNYLIVLELRNLGIPMENIYQSEYCTFENKDLFFSKKRKTPTGKMLSIIRFKK